MLAPDNHEQPDLTVCDREPIHIIGRIQSFGWLFTCSADWVVNHASINCDALFGQDAADLIGAPVSQLIDGDALHEIRTRLQMLVNTDSVERIFDIALMGDDRLFDLAVHRSGSSYVIEAEPAATGKKRDHVSYVRPLMQRLRQYSSVGDLCNMAARMMRGLTGFDRVMIYRFGESGAGEVIAEDRSPSVDGFLGLHFPASDIPAQARALYTRNLLRIISDVDDATVPIIPARDPDGQPLDLSLSALRAVSPVHIEYLQNMGVKASMSVSIMRRGKLWGLFACHHYAPLRLPYSARTAAELLGELFAYALEQGETDEASNRRGQASKLHDDMMARLAGGVSLLHGFDQFAEMIAQIIPFDGIAILADGEMAMRGTTPGSDQLKRLFRFLNTTGASKVWSTENLSDRFPEAAEYSEECAGLLSLPISRKPRDYIVLFRKEYVHDVEWGGNPDKVVEQSEDGIRLSPRKSFERWKQTRRGQSRRWDADEVATAESLRVTLLEVVLQMAENASQEREHASRQQDFLIAELNHRVRNILNLINGLVNQSKAGSSTIDEFAEVVGSRIYALSRAHDQLTQVNLTPSSLRKLIRTEGDAYAGDQAGRIKLKGIDAAIRPQAFTPLALVVHELMTNSCKYGALSVDSGLVTIALAQLPGGALSMTWAEQGGPEVTPPSRRGFGSAIIEHSIPHELGGTARVDYAPAGLQALFTVPKEEIICFVDTDDGPDADGDAGDQPDGPVLVRENLGEVMIVEDNIIIAMETEQIMRNLGFADVHICGSENSALQLLDSKKISAAVLDINLGKQRTSKSVADRLEALDIPFIVASGYGEAAGQEGFPDVPLVNKPYSQDDIQRALKKLGFVTF